MIQNLIGLNLNKINTETLRTWFCHISKDKNLTVKLRVSTTEELRKRLIALKREMDQIRKQYIKEKGYIVLEMWECEWWNLYKTSTCVKEHLRESFPYKRPLREMRLLEQIRRDKLFGYVHCEIEVPEELMKNSANFAAIFKNINVCRHDIGLLMKVYAEKKRLLCQPRKTLISSYFLENGILITPLLLFHLDLGLACKKFVASWIKFQLNVSINLCNLLSMPVETETRIQVQMFSRKK